MKKTREQKITGQIDRLLEKNLEDNQECEGLVRRNAVIVHTTDTTLRMEFNQNEEKKRNLEFRIQRRSALLKRKGHKLSEEKTMTLI